MMSDYTPEQLGEIQISPINNRTKDRYSLLVIQAESGDQVLLLEPCSWDKGRKRVVEMVRAGVAPNDIRFVWRGIDQLDTDSLPLRPCREALWWTAKDQLLLDAERAVEDANA